MRQNNQLKPLSTTLLRGPAQPAYLISPSNAAVPVLGTAAPPHMAPCAAGCRAGTPASPGPGARRRGDGQAPEPSCGQDYSPNKPAHRCAGETRPALRQNTWIHLSAQGRTAALASPHPCTCTGGWADSTEATRPKRPPSGGQKSRALTVRQPGSAAQQCVGERGLHTRSLWQRQPRPRCVLCAEIRPTHPAGSTGATQQLGTPAPAEGRLRC